jgi:hypothetical protein
MPTTSQNNIATKLTNENKKDEKYPENTASICDESQTLFGHPNGEIDFLSSFLSLSDYSSHKKYSLLNSSMTSLHLYKWHIMS